MAAGRQTWRALCAIRRNIMPPSTERAATLSSGHQANSHENRDDAASAWLGPFVSELCCMAKFSDKF